MEKILKLLCSEYRGIYMYSMFWLMKVKLLEYNKFGFFLTFLDFLKKIINEMYGMIICKFYFNVMLKIIVYGICGNIIIILCLMWDV